MARINLLKHRQIETLPPGFYSDGSNLFLRVNSKTSRQWVFRYRSGGKAKQLGLGSTTNCSLVDARELAAKMRRAIRNGGDPAAVLNRRDPNSMTFKKYAEELVAAKKVGFKSEKHGKQWDMVLSRYAYPTIGDKRADDVSLSDVETILRPLWATKTETASRLRSRIASVLDYAYVAEGLEKRNPADFKGNLAHRGFVTPRKITPVKHHPAAPYTEIPAIMEELRGLTSTTAFCLRFTILTWARSSEVRGAIWPEFDNAKPLWSIPAKRMKAGRPHDVPLCEEAREILDEMRERKIEDCDFVFPGARGGLLSDVGVSKLLHRLPTIKKLDTAATAKLRANATCDADREAEAHGAVVHGFRSTARSWAAARTTFEPFVLELALAHENKDRVEAAYQRDKVLEKRGDLMDEWGKYCRNSNVVSHPRFAAG